jgi:hypothetical protein
MAACASPLYRSLSGHETTFASTIVGEAAKTSLARLRVNTPLERNSSKKKCKGVQLQRDSESGLLEEGPGLSVMIK